MERSVRMSVFTDINDRLFELRDEKYAEFQQKLTPTLTREDFVGVRTPQLRKLAKDLSRREDIADFLSALPHKYFDENQLHSFIISLQKDFDDCIALTEQFLPYVNNWATCDQLSPKIFAKHRTSLLPYIDRWLTSEHTYTVRFAVGMLMQHFLGEGFRTEYADRVAQIRSEEYYINMMRAWYFATALAKNYDTVLPYIEEKQLDKWTHNKAIQKSVESCRITDEQKSFLKSLRIK